MPAVMEQVERWIADDPDPEAQAELRALLERGAKTSSRRASPRADLRHGGPARRARRGPGADELATVRPASAGLARYLLDAVDGAAAAGIVIGHDAPRLGAVRP